MKHRTTLFLLLAAVYVLVTPLRGAADEVVKPAEMEREAPQTRHESTGETPFEYAGAARPRERVGAIRQIERARKSFQEKAWARGLDILDRLLSEDEPQAAAEPPAGGEKDDEKPDKEAEVAVPQLPPGVVVLGGGRGFRRGGPAPQKKAEKKEAPAAPPSQVLFTEDGIHHVPIDREVQRILLELPAEAREVYGTTYEPPAKKMLEAAMELPFEVSLVALTEIARRYPMTASGMTALGLLGDRALDLGQSGRAVNAFTALLERIPAVEVPRVAARAIFAGLLAGRRTEAEALLGRIRRDHGAALISIRGKPVTGAAFGEQSFIKALLDRARDDTPQDLVEWSCAMGRPDHGALSLSDSARPPLGSRARWIHSFASSDATADAGDDALSPEARQPLRQTSFYRAFPAVQVATRPGLVLVRSRGELVAIDGASGKIRWRTNLAAVGSTSLQFPSPGQDRANFENLGGSSISVIDDVAIIIDTQSPAIHDNKGRLSYAPNTLFAFDVRTGKLAWRVGGPDGFPRELRNYCFTAPPTHAGGELLVAPVTRGDGPSMVALSVDGTVRWVEKLYDYNAGYLQHHRHAVSQGASLAVAGGLVVAAPGHGIVTAVEAESGRVLWMTRYRTLAYDRRTPLEDIIVWAPSQPVISGGRVIVAPFDSAHLLAIEAASGETLWETAYGSDKFQLLGADGERVFVVGDRVEAVDITTGKRLWQSKSLRRAAGRGLVTTTHIYVPLEGEIAVLASAKGEIVARMGFTDPRMAGLAPGNLALVALDRPDPGDGGGDPTTRLVASGSWGIAVVEPQEESWVRIEARGKRKSFDRARLLRAEGRYDEALDLLEVLLEASKSEPSVTTARGLLIATAREASRRRFDPRPIERILRRGFKLDTKVRIALELEMAHIGEARDPAAAAALYHKVIAALRRDRFGGLVFTPDGVQALPARYALESLRVLMAAEKIPVPADEDAAAHERIAAAVATDETDPTANSAKARRVLEDIAFGQPYLPAATEALSHLARLAAASGDAVATLHYLERIAGRDPALRHDETIRQLRDTFNSTVHRPERLPGDLARVLRNTTLTWKQSWWKGIDHGFLVETVTDSRALRKVLALGKGRLHVFDLAGEKLGDAELPEFPDIEKTKAGLKSHIEEPGRLYSRGADGILFTAAGVYHLALPENPVVEKPPESPQQPEQDGPPKEPSPEPLLPEVSWHQTYRHPIDVLHGSRGRIAWGRSALSRVSGNLFPKFLLTPDGREGLVLRPDGELISVDLQSGKVRFRVSDVAGSPTGTPVLRGDRLVATMAAPGGVAVYDVLRRADHTGAGQPVTYSLRGPSDKLFGAALVPGIAVVFDTSRGVEVRDASGRQTLWKADASRPAATLVRATGSEVWSIDPRGAIESRDIVSGRRLWSAPIPRNATAIAAFPAPSTDSGQSSVWVAVVTDGSRSSFSGSRYNAVTQTGTSLALIRLTESGDVLADVRIGGAGVTYVGQRWIVDDLWLLAYNEATEKGRWVSRLSSFDPVLGALRVLCEAPIAGKGTALPPRVALVTTDTPGDLALALGNAEGFGLYRAEKPPAEREKAAKSDEKGEAKSGTIVESNKREKDS